MGNCWKGISDERLAESEQRIIGLTGMKLEDFELTNVIINEQGDYARTIRCGNVS